MLDHCGYAAAVSVPQSIVQSILDALWEADRIPSSLNGSTSVPQFGEFSEHALHYSLFADRLQITFKVEASPQLSVRLLGNVEFTGLSGTGTNFGQSVDIRLAVSVKPYAELNTSSGVVKMQLCNPQFESVSVRSARGVPIPMHVSRRIEAALLSGWASSLINGMLNRVETLVPPLKIGSLGSMTGIPFEVNAAEVLCHTTNQLIVFGVNLSFGNGDAGGFFGAQDRLGTRREGGLLDGTDSNIINSVVHPGVFRFFIDKALDQARHLIEQNGIHDYHLGAALGDDVITAHADARNSDVYATADGTFQPRIGKEDERIYLGEEEDGWPIYRYIRGHSDLWLAVIRLDLSIDEPWWVDFLAIGAGFLVGGPIGSAVALYAVRQVISDLRSCIIQQAELAVHEATGTLRGNSWIIGSLPGLPEAIFDASARKIDLDPNGGIELEIYVGFSKRQSLYAPGRWELSFDGPSYLPDAWFLKEAWEYRLGKLNIGPYRLDPTLHVRWRCYSSKGPDAIIVQDALYSEQHSRTLVLDLNIADRREYSRYRIECSIYRLTATGVETLATNMRTLLIGDSNGMNEEHPFVRWSHVVAVPIYLTGPDGALSLQEMHMVRRVSDIHLTRHLARCRFAISALNPETWLSGRLHEPKKVSYFDELPFPTDAESLNLHRSELCDYCFYGGPTRDEIRTPLVSRDWRAWYRKHDGHEPNPPKVPSAEAHWYPKERNDLSNLVQWAERHPPLTGVPGIRASGSHWALSEAAVSTGNIVETSDPTNLMPRLNRVLRDVISPDGCLTSEALEFFESQPMTAFDPVAAVPSFGSPDESFYLMHVEAGIRIYELYNLLDQGEEARSDFHLSLASRFPQYHGPWAMATLGGAGGQTIAGAISTGTHGGDVHLPPISDCVQAIHLVGAGGIHYWIERDLPGGVQLTDDAALRSSYGKIEIIRDPDVFWSVVVSAGRLGIIYSMVLRVVRQYALHQNQAITMTWTELQSKLSPTNPLFQSSRFVSALVTMWPTLTSGGDLECSVTTRIAVPLTDAGSPDPLGRRERSGANAGVSSPLGQSDFLSLISSKGSLAAVAGSFDPQDAGLVQSINFVRDERQRQQATVTFGDEFAAVCNYLAAQSRTDLVRAIVTEVLQSSVSEPLTAISYAVMDGHDYTDVGALTKGDSIEVFFDATSPELRTFIAKVAQQAASVQANGSTAVVGWMALRFMGKTQALLGMQRWPLTCSVEIACMGGVTGTEPFLSGVETDAIQLGGILHWGQRNQALSRSDVERAFAPDRAIERWRDALRRLSPAGTPDSFSTLFSVRVGLEP